MGSITIRSSGGTLKATVPRVLKAARHSSLSGEMTFSCLLQIGTVPGVTPGDVLSYGGEDYDVVRVAKRTAVPKPLQEISCEHVSYRLNEDPLPAGTYYGTPAEVLTQLLDGTGFSVGTVEVTETTLYSFTSPTNVRDAVIRWAAATGAEISFSGLAVSLLQHIGSTVPVELSDKKNVESLSAVLDDRSDSQSYDVTFYRETALALGDAISIDYDSLGLHATSRVCSIDADPFNPMHVKIVTGTPVPAFVDSVIRALNDKVGLGQPYFGTTISREHGIKIERSDGASELLLNSDVMSWRAMIDGVMRDRLIYNSQAGDLEFHGRLAADAILAASLYAETGDVAELTVDRLSTSRRIRKYILGDTSDDNYISIQDNYIKFITGAPVANAILLTQTGDYLVTEDDLYLVLESADYVTTQATNRNGELLYWQREPVGHTSDGYPTDEDGKQIYASTDVTDWPVTIYLYKELVKAQYAFAEVDGVYQPQVILGAGDENGNSRGYLYKAQRNLLMRYVTSAGKNVDITFDDSGFVDAMHRRLKSCDIDPELGIVTYFVEGDELGHQITFTIDGDTVTYTWPDGFECTVTIPEDVVNE